MTSRRLSTGRDSRIGNPVGHPIHRCEHPLRRSFRSRTGQLRRRCSSGRTVLQALKTRSSPSRSSHLRYREVLTSAKEAWSSAPTGGAFGTTARGAPATGSAD